MKDNKNLRLCGGTLFTILLEINKTCKSTQDERFRDFLGIIDPEVLDLVRSGEVKDYLHTYASRFKNCKDVPNGGRYIHLGNSGVCATFKDEIKTNSSKPLGRIVDFDKKYIKKDSRSLLVRVLLELIEADSELDDNADFYVLPEFKSIKKQELLKENIKISYFDFLLGIWFYVYENCGDNTIGEPTIKTWREEAKLNGNISIFNTSPKYQNIDISYDIKEEGNIHEEEYEKSQLDTRFGKYMTAAYEKYSIVKTFFYKTTRPFRDIYECNDLIVDEQYAKINKNDRYRFSWHFPIIYARPSLLFSTRSLIVGQGGLGKSMMMNHLFLTAIDEYDKYGHIPIIIKLNDYDLSKTNFNDLILKSIDRFDKSLTWDIISEHLDKGKTVLLLDGMDEIQKNYLSDFMQDIDYFVDSFPKCQCIISSRDIPETSQLNNFIPYKLLPLSEFQSYELIKKIDSNVIPEEYKSRFIQDFKSNSFDFDEKEREEFLGNPLMLTIMLMSYYENGNIPKKRYLFYEQAYRALSSDHDIKTKGINRKFFTRLDEHDFQKYFGHFCADSYADYNFVFSAEMLERYFENVIREDNLKTSPQMFIKDAYEKLCLLYLDGRDYRFIHRSFQEYFAAYYFNTLLDSEYKDVYDVLKDLDEKIVSDQMMPMLYAMNEKRFEKYIVIPFLEDIYKTGNDEADYINYAIHYVPLIKYGTGELINNYIREKPKSALYDFITNTYGYRAVNYHDFLSKDIADFERKYHIVYVYGKQNRSQLYHVPDSIIDSLKDSNGKFMDCYKYVGEGYDCSFSIPLALLLKNEKALEIAFDKDFPLVIEFFKGKKLLERLKKVYSYEKKKKFGLGITI